jgi:hypothetical protein
MHQALAERVALRNGEHEAAIVAVGTGEASRAGERPGRRRLGVRRADG